MSSVMDKYAAYGVDLKVTMERFVGNETLYENCFKMLLSDQNIEALDNAVKARDYTAAFEAAHALKGVIANLGLAPLQEKISVLTEALRAGSYDNMDAQYAEVVEAFEVVKAL